jgi:hypothetical protein
MASELAQVKRAFYSLRVNTSKPVVVPDLSGASFLTLVAADLRATIVANPSERLSPPATRDGRSEIGRYLRIPLGSFLRPNHQ